MDIGLITSAVFFGLVAIAAIVGYSKGKKYVWQYTLTGFLTSVTAVIIAIPVTKALSELIADKLFAKLLPKKVEDALARLEVDTGVANAILAIIIGLFLFLFVRLIVKSILKFFSPTVSSLLISISDIVASRRAAKKAKRIAKEVAALEAALEAKEKALRNGSDGSSADAEPELQYDFKAQMQTDNEAQIKADNVEPIQADADSKSARDKARGAEKRNAFRTGDGTPQKEAKRNGCYALQPQFLSILIGIVGCIFGIVVVFAPISGILGLADDVLTSEGDKLNEADIVIDEELRSRLTEITGSSAVSFANSFGGELIFNRLATTDANGLETSLKDEVKLILSIIKEVKQS